uniref:Uncharacterized protein n=1 Tax=Falco tinnunculus TaxID=100819 RepID=A0A8C4TPI7_FALTI
MGAKGPHRGGNDSPFKTTGQPRVPFPLSRGSHPEEPRVGRGCRVAIPLVLCFFSCRQEQAIALSVMSVCFLLPAAWILAHIEHYKSRPE